MVYDLTRATSLDKGTKYPHIVAMSQEDRLIIFDYVETYKAIYTLCGHKHVRGPPPGTITAMKLKTGDPNAVTVIIMNAETGTNSRCEYSCDFLATALILYCRRCSIPLPRRGRKTVELTGESVLLRITL